MARKERNSVDYFPHSVSHGKKMFYLRAKFKNDGYAVWFMLLEELAKTEYHYLDLKEDVQLMYLSSEFMIDENVLIDIINILVQFEEFDSELWKDRILFNMKFIDNISDAYKKRNNDCINKDSLLLLLTAKGRIKRPKSNPNKPKPPSKGGKNPQTILKDIKVNQTDVDLIYYLYPTTCKVQNRPTAKGAKDKEKIKILLKEISLKDLSATITGYIENSKLSKSYIQNFSTFLNNLPDLQELRETWLTLSENNPDKEETAAEKLIRKKKRADLF